MVDGSSIRAAAVDPAALLADLQAAHAAGARIGARPPIGVRAVEVAPGDRSYMCVFEGPAFLCLTVELRPEQSERRVRRCASAGLLWEQLERRVDPELLRALAAASGTVLAQRAGAEALAAPLEAVAQRGLELAGWREQPTRDLAALVDLDAAVALQRRLALAYGRFVTASEPLVARQDELDSGLVAALRGVELAAVAAGAHESLAQALAGAVPACDEQAEQVIAAHLTRLRP